MPIICTRKGGNLMLKVSMLAASLLASLSVSATVAANSNQEKAKPRDARIIVEVDRSNDTLTNEGIVNTQNAVLNNIRTYATRNIEVTSRYSLIANAFTIAVNKDDIELIKQVPGVKSVTLNEMHWKSVEPQANEQIFISKEGSKNGEYGDSENISATTMKKSDDTYDGAGTTIAILDNEFWFRGYTDESESWNHVTFTDLDPSVPVKHTGRPTGYNNTFAYGPLVSNGITTKRQARPGFNNEKGKEGSLYFNRKVPFYFDYGGETTTYGSGNITPDFDVSSTITYHGSHVASIAAGNDPDYKGIAPNAQLFCMKVFTNYKASAVDQLLGFSSSSGAYDEPILNALEDCLALQVDGINMSLGSNLNDFDSDSITCKTINRLAENGILSAISAGNSGKTSYSTVGGYSNWTTEMVETGILSGYSNQSGAMTVAAGQPSKLFYENGFKLDGITVAFADQIINNEAYDSEYTREYKMEELFYNESTGEFDKSVDWQYIPGFGTAADYAKVDDVSGKIAVVNRGSTSFADKYNVAKGRGAIGLVVINNDPTMSDFNFRMSFGDDFKPTMPCALVLYKDKPLFENKKNGSIDLVKKEILDNPKALTISSFSSDGATFDLDLKPEITAPGENIRGAIPPQKSEDRTEDRRYKVYEYLSGTSMSAPNFAGVQSVMTSKEAGPIYASGKTPTKAQLEEIKEFKSTVNMRLMSTAEPMVDYEEDPEGHEFSYTSPRKQGAGMVDLGDAYRTNVYLEGLDEEGNGIGKSKINLKNNADINRGDIKLSFLAHNESKNNLVYKPTLVVMRPAIAATQDIVTKDYKDCGEVDKIENFPGRTYYIRTGVEPDWRYEERTCEYEVHKNDVYKVPRDIEYYASAYDCENDIKSYIKEGRYVYDGAEWQDYATYNYQSTYDFTIAEINLDNVTFAANSTTKIDLATYSLSEEQKNEIAKYYDYGCYLEGYVLFEPVSHEEPNLSIPYLGYYSVDHDNGATYASAPVVEPFSFEKNNSTVYPSDLVNDLAKNLIGKEKIDVGSMMVMGYLDPSTTFSNDIFLKNDDNFANISGFNVLGTDPQTGSYYDRASENLYIGSENYSNTLIIQQFVLRSVKENYFTITNKVNGKVVYKSNLVDMLFGEVDGKYPLFKSHVDDSYLSAGYMCHRAYAVVPMYDPLTGKAFETGQYELKFNYLLSGTDSWVEKTYNLNIDSTAPEVESITQSGNDLVFKIRETNLADVIIGTKRKEFTKISADTYQVKVAKSEIADEVEDNYNLYLDSGRLYIKLTDKAFGTNGIIVRFERNRDDSLNFSKYVMVQHHTLRYTNDFEDDGANIKLVTYNPNTGMDTPYTASGFVLISRGPVKYPGYITVQTGCAGNVATTSAILSAIALAGIIVLIIAKSKRKYLGGKD